MTGAQFFELYRNIELRQYIVDQAKRHSKNNELQKDFIQEAWMYIGLCMHDLTLEAYQTVAYNAIVNIYRKEKQERDLCLEDMITHQK